MSEQEPPMRSLLSRDMILYHVDVGNIFIHPFNKDNVKTTSYDVRLGTNFFRKQDTDPSKNWEILNPFDPKDIKRCWGEPQVAPFAADWMKHRTLANITESDKIIVLGPNETILSHTEEFIGGRNCVATEMRALSSVGRIGITVCKCAGWGGVGFCNRWTMEMTNHFNDIAVILVVGMRVAQIAFFQVDAPTESYVNGGGQYQTTDDTETMMREWSPAAMLPKFSRDWR